MDETRRKFYGLIYLMTGSISLVVGINFILHTLKFDHIPGEEFMIYIIPALVLTGITFFLGIKCIR